MDKQLEKEALEKYPKAWRHPTKAEQVAYFDPNEQKREAYIAGATSSSTVKELEKENRQLKNMYMELKADYDMLNEKYQQLSRPSSVEEPPIESWGIKDIQVLTAQGELSTCKVAVSSSDEKLESTVKDLEKELLDAKIEIRRLRLGLGVIKDAFYTEGEDYKFQVSDLKQVATDYLTQYITKTVNNDTKI